jgi:hypothetical protein
MNRDRGQVEHGNMFIPSSELEFLSFDSGEALELAKYIQLYIYIHIYYIVLFIYYIYISFRKMLRVEW